VAVNEIEIAASPETVFDLLADGHSYAEWVVGAKEIRAADPGFPEPGTRFHHSIGVGPLTIKDSTRVVELERPSRLVLEAHLGLLGGMLITLDLRERGGGTHVLMTESASAGIPARLLHRLGDVVLRGRNFLSLERLQELVENRR
jgi:uncharacterized protein YndB with AHSA1/START domain